jgi:excisionase family DNA binding protein
MKDSSADAQPAKPRKAVRIPGDDIPDPALPRLAYTVDEACAVARIRRDLFYALLSRGEGPRTFKLGAKRLVRHEALVAWLEERERATMDAQGAKAA